MITLLDSIDIKHASAAGIIPAIRTLGQMYSSSFEVRLVYFKVTFQLVGPDCLFWSAWILTYIEVNFLTFSVGVSVFSNFYWQRTKC